MVEQSVIQQADGGSNPTPPLQTIYLSDVTTSLIFIWSSAAVRTLDIRRFGTNIMF